LEFEHLRQTQLVFEPPPRIREINMPTDFFYPIITQHDVRRTLEGFEPYPEECGIPLPTLNSSDDNKNLRRLNKYWMKVDGFVREQYAGWKERQGVLERMQGDSEGGSEGGRKRGREETPESEEEVESPSKRKRTVSGCFLLSFVTEVRIRGFHPFIRTNSISPVETRFAISVFTRIGSVSKARRAVQTGLVLLVKLSTPLVGRMESPCQRRHSSSTTKSWVGTGGVGTGGYGRFGK